MGQEVDGVRKGGVGVPWMGRTGRLCPRGRKGSSKSKGRNVFFRCVAPLLGLFFPLSLVMEWR